MNYLIDVMPQLLQGATTTLKLFAFTILGSLPLGILLSFGLASKFKPLQWILRFYGLPLVGIIFDRFDAALFAFVLNYAAYYAEIFRGGIQSIPVGQYEASKVIGLTPVQTITRIIIPQVVKIVLPSVGNEVINLVKDTSLVYILGLSDVMRAGKIAMERDTTLLPLFGVAIIYLALTGVTSVILKQLENRLNYYR
jgi:polar amino acid transport system permease protein